MAFLQGNSLEIFLARFLDHAMLKIIIHQYPTISLNAQIFLDQKLLFEIYTYLEQIPFSPAHRLFIPELLFGT